MLKKNSFKCLITKLFILLLTCEITLYIDRLDHIPKNPTTSNINNLKTSRKRSKTFHVKISHSRFHLKHLDVYPQLGAHLLSPLCFFHIRELLSVSHLFYFLFFLRKNVWTESRVSLGFPLPAFSVLCISWSFLSTLFSFQGPIG